MPRLSLRSACNNARAAETPLWYYTLREADVRHEGPSWPLGSRIVGEALIVLLALATCNGVAVCIVDVREVTIRDIRHADRVVANGRIVAHIHGGCTRCASVVVLHRKTVTPLAVLLIRS